MDVVNELGPVAIHPRCGDCHEPWDEPYGCSTLRALAVLSVAEQQRDEAERALYKATLSLSELAAKPEWHRDPTRHVITASVVIDGFTAIHSGSEFAMHAIAKMAREVAATINRVHDVGGET